MKFGAQTSTGKGRKFAEVVRESSCAKPTEREIKKYYFVWSFTGPLSNAIYCIFIPSSKRNIPTTYFTLTTDETFDGE